MQSGILQDAMQQTMFHPEPAPGIEETGLPRNLIFELVMKRLFSEGTTTLQRLARELKLDFDVIHTAYRNMLKEQICETKGMVGNDYEFSLTGKGIRMAEEVFRRNPYVGPAPVPLNSYCQAVTAQAFRPQVTHTSLTETFADLVVGEDVIRDLGGAIMTGGTLFLYGPTGNGKTSIALRLHRIFHDFVYVPYAVEVANQILAVYDPIVHRPAERQPGNTDPRWVLCQRPFLMVGGEMRAEMLEARLDEVTRLCVAPLQMKANNGILVIDDFGRQHMQPRELLNRWIVPLDRRVDYLALWSGVQFEIPFDLMVIFATNLELSQLAEEAFIRRIKNKVKIEAIAPQTFLLILRRICEERGIPFDPKMAEYACQQCAKHSPTGLRACFPRDLMDLVCGVASFEERPPTLERSGLDEALKLYFTR